MINSLKCGTVYSPDLVFCHSSPIQILHTNTHCKDTVPDVFTKLTFPNRSFTPEIDFSGYRCLRDSMQQQNRLVLSHVSTSCRIISEIVFNWVLCNSKVFLHLLPKLWLLEPKVAAAERWLCEPAEAFAVGSWSRRGAIDFVPPGLPTGLDKDSSQQLLLVLSCP